MTINPWYRYTLNSSTYTAIDGISTPENGTCELMYYTEDGSEFMVANDSDGTNAYTIPGGNGITENITVVDGVAFYAKSSSGSPNLVVKTGSPSGTILVNS